MRQLPFTKMHGLGNDFVVVDGRDGAAALSTADVVRLGDRRRGVGFDQLVLIEPSDAAHAKLTFFNPDGGEAGACGNGTRCAARLLFDRGGPWGAEGPIDLETAGGTLHAWDLGYGRYRVAMAPPRWGWRDLPLAEERDTLAVGFGVEGLPAAVATSMGNPHVTFFVEDADAVDASKLGPLVENHPLLPKRANVGFASVQGPGRIRLRVWERGAGLTEACGSGACAGLVAAARRGLNAGKAVMALDGGELEIEWPGGASGEHPAVMTGVTAIAFEGAVDLDLLAVEHGAKMATVQKDAA